MLEEEAREIVMNRIAHGPDTVEYSKEAIEAAVARMMGKEVKPIPHVAPPPPKVSPFLAHTYGLHEKYMQDG
tara:strand:- start:10853 stop:11068 length:216 start_codon:yes stop_codon:yes gene_type:complete